MLCLAHPPVLEFHHPNNTWWSSSLCNLHWLWYSEHQKSTVEFLALLLETQTLQLWDLSAQLKAFFSHCISCMVWSLSQGVVVCDICNSHWHSNLLCLPTAPQQLVLLATTYMFATPSSVPYYNIVAIYCCTGSVLNSQIQNHFW
jgi:hypothetical protein